MGDEDVFTNDSSKTDSSKKNKAEKSDNDADGKDGNYVECFYTFLLPYLYLRYFVWENAQVPCNTLFVVWNITFRLYLL